MPEDPPNRPASPTRRRASPPQVEHATAYAVGRAWAVAAAHVYVDDGISGAEFVKRPGFLRLMNALKPKPPFQILIMSEESRLGREQIETAYALKQIIRVYEWAHAVERAERRPGGPKRDSVSPAPSSTPTPAATARPRGTWPR